MKFVTTAPDQRLKFEARYPFDKQVLLSMSNRFLILLMTLFTGAASFAQETAIYRDPQQLFKQGKEYFQKEQYSLAYPVFREVRHGLREADQVDQPNIYREALYYSIVCGLMLNQDQAVDEAKRFMELERDQYLKERISFHLAEYYFRNNKMADAVQAYESSNFINLSNEEISTMKFHQGYAYFTLQRFAEAQPLLYSIAQNEDDRHFEEANYYLGLIEYQQGHFSQSLTHLKNVDKHPVYSQYTPFYIAGIYYFTGQKEKAISSAEEALKKKEGYYEQELHQLLGHLYYEKKDFKQALPHLEKYVKDATSITRMDQYELSYCYYQQSQWNKAIEGFKQLSGGEDSLSQNSMYMLGDAYLKTGQKTNARNAFLFCSENSSNLKQKEVSIFNYGKLSAELGFQQEALNTLRNFIQQYPGSTYNNEARVVLLELLTKTNNYREAINLLDQVKEPNESVRKVMPRILYGRSLELINDQQLTEADKLLERVLKDPNAGSVLSPSNFWRGEIAYRQQRIPDAIRYYSTFLQDPVVSGDANPRNARYSLAYSYIHEENYAQALNYLEQTKVAPNATSSAVEQDIFLRQADCYYMLRQFSKAKTLYSQVISQSWSTADYATYQSALISGISSSNEKISLLKSMERKYPNSPLLPDVKMEIADTYLSDEKYRDAIPYLQSIINFKEATAYKPKAHLNLGLAYFNLNQNKQALEQYQMLVNEYPNTPEAEQAIESVRSIMVEEGKSKEFAEFMRKAGKPLSVSEEDEITYKAAENKLRAGDNNGALNAFNQYLQQFPQGSSVLAANHHLAEIYRERKDYVNALKYYDAVIEGGQNIYLDNALSRAARITYFERKDYVKAEGYFERLKLETANAELKLDAMRGLIRTQYEQKKWKEAVPNAQDLLKERGASQDDKVLSNMVLARSLQESGGYSEAISAYRNVLPLNKAMYAAEARYRIAECYFLLNDWRNAEKAALETIKTSGSYDSWITRSYIMLGDIAWKQKDYFNAKATFTSVVENSKDSELKKEAETKLQQVIEEEKKAGKIDQ